MPPRRFTPHVKRPLSIEARKAVAAIVLAGMLLPSLWVSKAQADYTLTRNVASGVILRQTIQESPNAPLIVTVLDVDLNAPGVRLQTGIGQDVIQNDTPTAGREAVSTFVKRKGVTAAVNADYFIGSAPVGLSIRDGELISLPYPNRAVCAVLPDGRVAFDIPGATAIARGPAASFPLTAINKSRGADALILYTPTFGSSARTNDSGVEAILSNLPLPLKAGRSSGVVKEVRVGRGNAPLQPDEAILSGNGKAVDFLKNLKPGDPIDLSIQIQSPSIANWGAVQQAVGGGPFLVRDGKIAIDAAAEKFKPDVVLGQSPRTAIGVTRDGHFLIVAADGRQLLSAGLSLKDLAALMLKKGCVTAMNLDGGGSTSMAAQGIRISSPSDGSERSVAEVLAVIAPPLPLAGERAPRPFNLLAEMDGPISSGQSVSFELRDENGEPISPDAPVLWGIEGPIGFVDQNGYFRARKAGAGRVVARWGDVSASADVQVISATDPAKIIAIWAAPDPTRPMASQLTATVLDANENPITGVSVVLTLPSGASADALSKPTDAKGTATFDIAWPSSGSRSATVKSGGVMISPTPPPVVSSPTAPASPSP